MFLQLLQVLNSAGIRAHPGFLAVTTAGDLVINSAISCHDFLPGLRLPSQLQSSVIFVLIYFLVLVLVFQLFFRFSFVLVLQYFFVLVLVLPQPNNIKPADEEVLMICLNIVHR